MTRCQWPLMTKRQNFKATLLLTLCLQPREKAAEAAERMRGKAAKAWPLVSRVVHTHIHTHTHTHTYRHTHAHGTHTRTHTYTHTIIQTFASWFFCARFSIIKEPYHASLIVPCSCRSLTFTSPHATQYSTTITPHMRVLVLVVVVTPEQLCASLTISRYLATITPYVCNFHFSIPVYMQCLLKVRNV